MEGDTVQHINIIPPVFRQLHSQLFKHCPWVNLGVSLNNWRQQCRLSCKCVLEIELIFPLAICEEIGPIKNGQKTGDGTYEGDEITFTCDQNFMLVGEKVLKCLGNGKWNASEPECKGKD
jgi:hypothetical protein